VVVGSDRVLGRQLGDVRAGDRLRVAAVLHHDHEDMGGVGFRRGEWGRARCRCWA